MSGDRLAGRGAPPFEAMAATHRRTARGYRVMAIGLLVAGAVIAAAGLLAGAAVLVAAVGLVVAASAAVAWKKSVEHRERGDGVEVLQEEWQDAASLPERRARLLGLIRHLYA